MWSLQDFVFPSMVLKNADTPGVIGQIGTTLGKHGVNIATFALGRDEQHAVGVVVVDETAPIPDAVLTDLLALPAIREARLVRI